ncbi:MAG: ComF family protein [Chlamydiae bacterium]|nr:ComF family protein [Chlamydiota bacterium]MBI3277634.1 ComF family protein [Chlamydiota bacterium]
MRIFSIHQFQMNLRMLGWVLADLLFPRHCEHCLEVMSHENRTYLCDGCFDLIGWIPEPACHICAKPFPGLERKICSPCSRSHFSYEACYAIAIYEGLLKELLRLLKFAKAEYLVSTFQRMFLAKEKIPFSKENVDIILPVPLHPLKMRERGFNQACILGEAIRDKIQRPLLKGVLIRAKYSGGQTLQDRKDRLLNIQGSFKCKNIKRIEGKRVLLVDDVLTTGATIEECSRVLKEAGASSVTVWVLARSI